MTHQAFLVHRHVLRPDPRQAKGDPDPPSSPGAPGTRRSSVKLANLVKRLGQQAVMFIGIALMTVGPLTLAIGRAFPLTTAGARYRVHR